MSQNKTKEIVRKNNRMVRQEDMRERIRGSQLLGQIVKQETEFARIYREAKDKGQLTAGEKNRFDVMLKALGMRQASTFKKLDKVLADLKAIELTDGDGNPVVPVVQVIANGQPFNPFPSRGEVEDVEFSVSSETADSDTDPGN